MSQVLTEGLNQLLVDHVSQTFVEQGRNSRQDRNQGLFAEDDRGCMFDFQSGAGRVKIRVCLQGMTEVVFDFQSGAGRVDRVEIWVCLQRMMRLHVRFSEWSRQGRQGRNQGVFTGNERSCMFDFQSGAGRADRHHPT